MRAATKLLIVLAAIPTIFIISFGCMHQYRRTFPDRAFVQITGRALPVGVRATDYNWTINDNLFHVGHYWLLTGSSSALHQFPFGTSLSESTQDARQTLPDTEHLFGEQKTASQVVVGYEDDSPRNNWYWIFTGETTALYEHN